AISVANGPIAEATTTSLAPAALGWTTDQKYCPGVRSSITNANVLIPMIDLSPLWSGRGVNKFAPSAE
ncbi:MAG: hypothetical protein JWQ73_2311, partial [Variovorax sp.]|nr:hypothetical protein [Variovorax sp.]